MGAYSLESRIYSAQSKTILRRGSKALRRQTSFSKCILCDKPVGKRDVKFVMPRSMKAFEYLELNERLCCAGCYMGVVSMIGNSNTYDHIEYIKGTLENRGPQNDLL